MSVCEGKGGELDDAPSGIDVSGRLGVPAERRLLLGVSVKPFIFRLRDRDAGRSFRRSSCEAVYLRAASVDSVSRVIRAASFRWTR
ncbi:hypothetical protein MRX96_015245 [Rhipicephalus microplus]